MIVVIALTLLAVAGILATRIVWVRIDNQEKERVADREQLLILTESIRVELHEAIASVVRDAAHMRQVHNGDYADLLQKYTDLRDVEAGIVEFLDDVPQNFAFHKAGINYTLRLPDRLRMVLHREG